MHLIYFIYGYMVSVNLLISTELLQIIHLDVNL